MFMKVKEYLSKNRKISKSERKAINKILDNSKHL